MAGLAWPAKSRAFSNGQNASAALGQISFTAKVSSGPTPSELYLPLGVAFDAAGNLWVADSYNNRVLEYVPPFASGMSASLVLGQSNFTSNGSATTQSGLWLPDGLAFDTTGDLWVSEIDNNRVVEFVPPFSNGMNASLVLGQSNFALRSSGVVTQSSLYEPEDVAVDTMTGNVWVADSYNNRVLEYVPPFSDGMNASLVLGQGNFTSSAAATTQSGFNLPQGLGFDGSGNLWVADLENARVLEFVPTFSSGMNASLVLGQANFTSHTTAATQAGMDAPSQVFVDAQGNLWVADYGDNRVTKFSPPFSTGMNANLVLGQSNFTNAVSTTTQSGLANPAGIAVGPRGTPWVADTSNNRVVAFGPTVGISYPAGGTLNSLGTISGTAVGSAVAISTVILSVNDMTSSACYDPGDNAFDASCPSFFPAAGSTATWSFFFSTQPWMNGHQYVVRSSATDFNLQSTSATAAFLFDNAPPLSYVAGPPNGSFVNSLPGLSGTAADPGNGSGVAAVWVGIEELHTGLWWTGASFSTPTMTWQVAGLSGSSPTWTWSYASGALGTSLVSGDSYYVTSSALDNAGNEEGFFNARGSTFTFSTVPPVSAVVGPPTGAYVNALPGVSGTAGDPVGVSTVALSIEDVMTSQCYNPGTNTVAAACPRWFPAQGAPANWSFLFPVQPWLTGHQYVLSSSATDVAGNVQASVAQSVVVYDTASPTMAILSPPNGSEQTGFPALSGTAADPISAVAAVQVSISSGPLFTTSWNGAAWVNSTFTWLAANVSTPTWSLPGPLAPPPSQLQAGATYQISVQAIDHAGNAANQAAQFAYAPPPPTVAILSPPSGAQIPVFPSISGTAQPATYPLANVVLQIQVTSGALAGYYWSGSFWQPAPASLSVPGGQIALSTVTGAWSLLSFGPPNGTPTVMGIQLTATAVDTQGDQSSVVSTYTFVPIQTSALIVNLAPPALPPTVSDQPMAYVKFWTNYDSATLVGVNLSLLGNLPSGIASAKIYLDTLGNGIFNPGVDPVIGSTVAFTAGTPPVTTLALTTQLISTTPVQDFLTISYSSAAAGRTVGLGVLSPNDLEIAGVGGEFNTNPAGFPLQSAVVPIQIQLFANPSVGGYPTPTPSVAATPSGGFDTGLYVNGGQNFDVQSSSQPTWTDGIHPSFGAQGAGVGNGGLAANVALGSLVGRIGSGPWFEIGAGSTATAAASGELYLAMSATTYSLASGSIPVSFSVLASTAPKTWVGGTPGFQTAANVSTNWSPAVLPGAGDTVIFTTSSWSCDWNLSNVELASLQILPTFNQTITLGAATAGVGNSLTVDTDVAVDGGAFSLGEGSNTFTVHGWVSASGRGTLDMGAGGGVLQVNKGVVLLESGSFTDFAQPGAAITQDFGSPTWTFNVAGGTVDVEGGLAMNPQTVYIGFSIDVQQPYISAFDNVSLTGAPSGSAAVVLESTVPVDWEFDGWQFAVAGTTINVDASGMTPGSSVEFDDATGPLMGSVYDNDPNGVITWDPDGGSAGTISGYVQYSGARSGENFYLLVSTQPNGGPGPMSFVNAISSGTPGYSYEGLPAPATYYLFGYADQASTPVPVQSGDPRGALGSTPGSWGDAVPVFLGPGGNIDVSTITLVDWSVVYGTATNASSQVGPVRVQAWRGVPGQPGSTLESQTTASPPGQWSLSALPATNYYFLGFVDLENNGQLQSFEAQGSSAVDTVLLDQLDSSVNFLVTGGTAAPGGVLAVSTGALVSGFMPSSGDQGLLRLTVTASSQPVTLSGLQLQLALPPPPGGVNLFVYQDALGTGQLQEASDPLKASAPGVTASAANLVWGQPDTIPAGATRSYIVGANLLGQTPPAFGLVIPSSMSFSLAAGAMAPQPLYPMSVVAVPRFPVPASVAANPNLTGGAYTGVFVGPGQTLVVLATGTWDTSPSTASAVTADGAGPTGLNTVLPSARLGQLIGRVDGGPSGASSPWFALGQTTAAAVNWGGQLVLAMNDYVGNYAGNAGEVLVGFSVVGSTVGTLEGTVSYAPVAASTMTITAAGPTASFTQLLPVLPGTTSYPYLFTQIPVGPYTVSAGVLGGGSGGTFRPVPVVAGSTATANFTVYAGTGSLSGTLLYSGVADVGQFVIAAATTTDFEGNPVFFATVSTPAAGSYTLPSLPAPATYYVVAFRDGAGTGQPEGSDPFGYYGSSGAAISEFPSYLSPVFVSSGAGATGVSFPLSDMSSLTGTVALPPLASGAQIVFLTGRGVPGSASFFYEDESVIPVEASAQPQAVDYTVDLLRPATDYSLYAFLDLHMDDNQDPGDPSFVNEGPLTLPPGGALSLDFSLAAPAPPPPVTGFTAASSTNAVVFQWNLVQGATQYQLLTSTGGVRVYASSATDVYADALGTDAPSSIVAIAAANFQGVGSSVTVAVAYSLAAAPPLVTVSSVSASSALLSWSSAGNAAGTLYSLARATAAGGPYLPIWSGTALGDFDSALSPSTSYYWAVQAVNGNGLATGLSAAGSTFTPVATGLGIGGTLSYAGAQPGPIRVQASTSPAFSVIAGSVTLPNSPSQPYFIALGAQGLFYVRAWVDYVGNGLLSPGEDAAATAPIDVLSGAVLGQNFSIAADTVPPASPNGLTAAPGLGFVALSWAPPTSRADGSALHDLRGYLVERSTSASAGFVSLTSLPVAATSFVDASPAPGAADVYRVVAVNWDGVQSTPTGALSVEPASGGSISGALTSFAAPATGLFHVRLSTSPLPNAPFLADSILSTFTFTGLANGTYFLRGFQDQAGTGQQNLLSEPGGAFGGLNFPYPIPIVNGNAVPGANVVVCDHARLLPNSTVSSSLSAGGCPALDVGSGYFTSLYSFDAGDGAPGSLGLGSQIVVTLNSSYDNQLVLLGPSGQVAASNNTAGGSASIRFTVNQSGVYLIEPTSFSPGVTGAYSLSLAVTGGFAGQIGGTVAYAGSQTGKVVVELFNTPLTGAAPVALSTYSAPGAFAFGGLPDGAYYVRAFRDAFGTLAQAPSDPSGVYGLSASSPTAVVVSGGQASVSPADLVVTMTDPAAGTVEGRVLYSGAQAGSIRIEAALIPCPGCAAGPVAAFASTAAAGAYALNFLAPATNYLIRAYVDDNGSGALQTLDANASSSPVTVTAFSTTTLNLVLLDPGSGAQGNATLSGNVTYGGAQGGPIYLGITHDPTFQLIDYVLQLSTQGAYSESGILGGTTYYLTAFRDVGGGGVSAPGDPTGTGGPVYAPTSSNVTANVTLVDPPGGSINGQVSYSGAAPASAPIIVKAVGPTTSSLRIARSTAASTYDFDLPFLAASTAYNLVAWVDVNGDGQLDPGDPVGFFGQPICSAAGCQSQPVSVSSGPGTFPTYGASIQVFDGGGAGFSNSGQINGSLVYLGVEGGPIVVRAFNNSSYAGEPLFTQSISAAPGPAKVGFSFANAPFGFYALDAFRDAAGAGQPAPLDSYLQFAQVTISSVQPSVNVSNNAVMVDPGGAGSLNVFTGSFPAASGARFDGGSSDLALGVAVDSVSAGAPLVYVEGLTTQLAGPELLLVKYSSTGVVLASATIVDNGSLNPHLLVNGSDVWLAGATPSNGGQTQAVLTRYAPSLAPAWSMVDSSADDFTGAALYNGLVYVGVQDAQPSAPDVVLAVNPVSGVIVATGTYNPAGNQNSDHVGSIAVDTNSASVYALLTTGSAGLGRLAAIVKFPAAGLGAPTIVKDVTGLDFDSGYLAVDPNSGNVYLTFFDRVQGLDWIYRYDSSLNQLGSVSVPNELSFGLEGAPLVVGPDDALYLAGQSALNGGDYLALKYSPALVPLATQTYDGHSGAVSDAASGLAVFDSSHVFITGAVNNGRNLDWDTLPLNLNASAALSGQGQTVVITTANATQAIYGQISYSGTLASSGTVRAGLYALGASAPIRLTTAPFAGVTSYLFNNVPAGVYQVQAFIDVNGDLTADPGDPVGVTASTGLPFLGTTLGGVNVRLCDRRTLTPNVPLHDALVASDCLSPDLNSTHQRLYTFSGARGQPVRIDLIASGFNDGYLILYGPTGAIVAQDESSGGPGHSLINNVLLPASGLYTVAAMAYSPSALGAFTLTLSGSSGSLGSIAGSVSYDGTEGGPIVVGLFDAPGFTSSTLVAQQAVSGSYQYSFAGLASGTTYYLDAWVDVNQNGRPDPGEDSGVFGAAGVASPIDLQAGQSLAGTSILISPSSTAAAAGYVTGAVTYGGTRSGAARVEFWSNPSFSGQPIAVRSLPTGPGPYDASVPGGVSYYVRAYVDVDNDETLDPVDPRGLYSPNGQGAQPLFVPVGGSAANVNVALADPGVSAAGVAGDGSAFLSVSSAAAGSVMTATVTFVTGPSGIGPSGLVGFTVPPGFAPPQAVTATSTSAATLSAVSVSGPSAFLTVTSGSLSPGQQVSFDYSAAAPCAVGTSSFVVVAASTQAVAAQALVSGSPAFSVVPGGPARFAPASPVLNLQAGQLSGSQLLLSEDACGNPAPLTSATTAELRAKVSSGGQFVFDPTFGLTTSPSVSTAPAVLVDFAAGQSSAPFYALAQSTGARSLELFSDLASPVTFYYAANAAPGNALSGVSVSTVPYLLGQTSAVIAPTAAGAVSEAFFNFTLGAAGLPWHVLVSSVPFHPGVTPAGVWESWGTGQPAAGSVAWDGRYEASAGTGRVPNGLYFVLVEITGGGVQNESLGVTVDLPQLSGTFYDTGVLPNPPLAGASLQVNGPSGAGALTSGLSGAYALTGVSAGLYTFSVSAPNFLPGTLQATLTAAGTVSTFTALTPGVSGAVNASGGLDVLMSRASALVVLPSLAGGVAAPAGDQWGSLLVYSSTGAAAQQSFSSPLHLAAGSTTLDDGGQWDPSAQAFVTHTTFRFALAVGTYTVQASMPGLSLSSSTVFVGASGATLSLPPMTAQASISGTVSVAANPSGLTVSVSAVPVSTATAGGAAAVVLPASQTSGAYSIAGLSPGAYLVRANAPGLLATATGPISVAAGAGVTGVNPPALAAGAQISGTVTVRADTSLFSDVAPSSPVVVSLSAWAPGTSDLGSAQVVLSTGVNQSASYVLTGLDAGTTYQVFADINASGPQNLDLLGARPFLAAAQAGPTGSNVTFAASSGAVVGTLTLPAGASDYLDVSLQGLVTAALLPEDVGQQFSVAAATALPNFTCQPSGATASGGYCDPGDTSAAFALTNLNSETLQLTFTYAATGQSRQQTLSIVDGSTTTTSVALAGQTYSISGAVADQAVDPLYNTIAGVLANAPSATPQGWPAGLPATTARVLAIQQSAAAYSGQLSTAFNPATTRVGYLTASGTYTITNVPSGVYLVRTENLLACATCGVLVPSVSQIVTVGAVSVSSVDFTLSDGYGVSGSVALAGGLQDAQVFTLSVLDSRQDVVASTTVYLGNAGLGVAANSVAYSFTNLPAGGFYTLTASAAGSPARYAGAPVSFPDPTASPAGLQASVSGLNVVMQRAAYIVGQLVDGGTGVLIGAGNAGLLAPTFQISATADPWVAGGYAVSASSVSGRPIWSDGSFHVGPLLPGVSYDLTLAQTSWSANYLAQGSQNYAPVTIAGITPQAGQTDDIGVVTLREGQSLSGTVRQSTTTGQLLGSIEVTATPSFGGSGVTVQTYTNAQGQYTLWVSTALSDQYDVTAAPRGGGQAANGQTYGPSTLYAVNLLATTTADFYLTPLSQAVTGQVVVADAATGGKLSYPFGSLEGFPAAAVYMQPAGVVPVNPLGDIQAQTDPTGAFSVAGLSTGTYTLRAASLGYSVLTATVTLTGSGFVIYTGSDTPSNYVPGNVLILQRGATLTGKILNSDGSLPNSGEISGVAAANFAAGSYLIGTVNFDPVSKTAQSYSISGFQPGVPYNVVVLPANAGNGVAVPPEGAGVEFSAQQTTASVNLNLTYTPPPFSCYANAVGLPNLQFQITVSCNQALRNSVPADNDLSTLLTVSTFSSTGASYSSPNGTGQFLDANKSVSSNRLSITGLYASANGETQFSIRVRAYSAVVNPATGSNYYTDQVFDFYTGLPSDVSQPIGNISGGSVLLQPSAQDEQEGVNERSRIDILPGTFALGSDTLQTGVASATTTITVGLTKAQTFQEASALYLRSQGYVPSSAGIVQRPSAVPAELNGAMQAYQTLAAAGSLGSANPLSSFYAIFLPAGVRHQLQQNATVTLSFSAALSTAAQANPDVINVWYYNTNTGNYQLENANRTLDLVNNTITVTVNHFSTFVVLDSTPILQAPNVAATSSLMAFNFPNPVDCIVHSGLQRDSVLSVAGVIPPFLGTMIRYSLPAGGDATEAKIFIYNMAGQKVRTIDAGVLAGGITYYSPWDCNNDSGREVASGVYVGEVSWGGQRKFFKIAIVKGSGL